jgi:hypothetical protein
MQREGMLSMCMVALALAGAESRDTLARECHVIPVTRLVLTANEHEERKVDIAHTLYPLTTPTHISDGRH